MRFMCKILDFNFEDGDHLEGTFYDPHYSD